MEITVSASTTFSLLLLLFLAAVASASSSFIADEAVKAGHGSVGLRTLLQQKTTCSVDFEKMNFTVITSQCKGPNYAAERCCTPLKELMCPVSEQINDLSSNCADTFFSYLNLYGKYPPGLFASLCKEGQQGLDCNSVLSPPPKSTASHRTPSLMLLLGVAMAMFLI